MVFDSPDFRRRVEERRAAMGAASGADAERNSPRIDPLKPEERERLRMLAMDVRTVLLGSVATDLVLYRPEIVSPAGFMKAERSERRAFRRAWELYRTSISSGGDAYQTSPISTVVSGRALGDDGVVYDFGIAESGELAMVGEPVLDAMQRAPAFNVSILMEGYIDSLAALLARSREL